MAGAIGSRRLSLREYGDYTIVASTDLDFQSLVDASLRWKRLMDLRREPFRYTLLPDGRIKLRAEEVTGVIRIGQMDIEIVPKFLNDKSANWQSVLWKILTVVEGGYVDEHKTSAHEIEAATLPDLLAEIFIASYSKGAAKGLPRAYRSAQSSGSVLRGQIDHSRIAEWVTRPWQMPYIADHLTDNTPLSQLLKWTSNSLAQTVTGPGRARALREISSSLSHVGHRPPHPIDADGIRLGVQHQGLEQALAISLMLLRGSGVQHSSGDFSLSGFLWRSDVIYEKFVSWLCAQAAAKGGGTIRKRPVTYGKLLSRDGTNLSTNPDVVFRDSSNEVVGVTDAKYKRFGTRPSAADTYQVLTAAHVLGCQRVSLTYPVSEYRKASAWQVHSTLGGKPIELSSLPLNLMALGEDQGVAKLIDVFTSWLRGTHIERLAL